jgi:addiction module HigA family antidote
VTATIHPGEHLAEELNELGMSTAELARKLDVPTNRITGILNGQRAITGDTALRLAHYSQAEESRARIRLAALTPASPKYTISIGGK